MKYSTKWASVLLWLVSASQTMGMQNVMQQPFAIPGLYGNNDKSLNVNAQSPQFEAMPPFPPDYSIPAFPLRGMPYESNDFNLQYQQPQFMPPIRLDIQFVPPPIYRVEAVRPFMPLPPQMSAPVPYVLVPPAATVTKNKTIPVDSETMKDGAAKNKTRRAVGFTYAPRFYLLEDTETKVIDTWRETNDFRYFSNKWWKGNAAKQINYSNKSNLKQYKNKHFVTTLHPLMLKTVHSKSVTKDPELPKKIKNMVRIVPLKKDILREVSAKLRQLKAKGKLNPRVGKLLAFGYDKYGGLNKIIDFHTPLKEDKINFINK